MSTEQDVVDVNATAPTDEAHMSSGIVLPPSEEELRTLFRPMRGDYIYNFLTQGGKTHPIQLTIAYIIASFGFTMLFSWANGSFWPIPGNKRLELLEDFGNILNFTLIIPVGILLVANFYHQLHHGVVRLLHEGIVVLPNPAALRQFAQELDVHINRKRIFVIAVCLSLALNSWLLLNLKTTWNALGEGVFVALWFRFFVFVNYSAVFYFLGKGIVTVGVLRRIFQQNIDMQPLHPDRCGGLLSVGRISGAINLFVAIVTLYITVLVVIDGVPLTHPAFLSIVAGFALLAAYLFFVPLWMAHGVMKAQKVRMLSALNRDFQNRYVHVRLIVQAGTAMPAEQLHQMEAVEKLHQLASRLPTWPWDVESLSKFVAVVVGPVLVAISKVYLLPWIQNTFN